MRIRAVSLVFALLAVGCTSSPGGQTVSSPASVPPAASPGSPTATAGDIERDDRSITARVPERCRPGRRPARRSPGGRRRRPRDGPARHVRLGRQGSDSPWLPGAPIAVGKGEPLTVRLSPRTTIASWQARIVAADASGPDGARPVGRGSGTPRFEAPRRGAWTLEVHLAFADGAGDASYFWRLDVQ